MKTTLSFSRRLGGFAALALGCFSLATAHAHYTWIDETGGKLTFRFGELGEERKIETSPGLLDRFATVRAWTAKGTAVKVEKLKDGFQFEGVEATEPVLAEELGLPVRAREGQPAAKQFFYLRWQPAKAGAGSAALTLDVVPEAAAGKYRVYFRGKPLAGAKVTARNEKGEKTALETDADGRISFTPSAAGLYLVTCSHKETIAGFEGGKAHESTSHSSTLTFRQP